MPSRTIQPEQYSQNNPSKLIINFGIFFSLIVILLLIYYPAIKTNYLFMEDYLFVNASSTQDISLANLLIDRTRAGKLLYGFYYYAISHISSARLIRLFGVISLGLFAYILYTTLKRYSVRSEHAFLLSLLACTLPSIQILIAWLTCLPYLYSAILSFIAGTLMFNFATKEGNAKPFHTAGSLLIVIVLLVIAMHIYQPTAMIYWTAGIIPLSLLKDNNLMKKWQLPFIKFFFAGFTAIVFYFFSVKILHFIFKTGFVGRGGLIELTKIPVKLKWFFFCPLNYALNLWNISPTYTLAYIVALVIGFGILLEILSLIRKTNGSNSAWNGFKRLLLTIGLILLSFLPNLIVTDNVPPYRTLGPLTITILFLFYFGFISVLNLLKHLPGFTENIKYKATTLSLIIFTLISGYHANKNVNDFAMLQASDLQYVKSVISEFGVSNLSRISEIYVRRADDKKIAARGFHYEFGLITTAHPWGVPNVTKVALRELGIQTNIKITQGAYNEAIPTGENILAIDMTKFDYLNKYYSSITQPQSYCLTIPERL